MPITTLMAVIIAAVVISLVLLCCLLLDKKIPPFSWLHRLKEKEGMIWPYAVWSGMQNTNRKRKSAFRPRGNSPSAKHFTHVFLLFYTIFSNFRSVIRPESYDFYILSQTARFFNRFKNIEITEILFSSHNRMKPEVYNRRKTRNVTDRWKLSTTETINGSRKKTWRKLEILWDKW